MILTIANILMVFFVILALWHTNIDKTLHDRQYATLYGILAQPFGFYISIECGQVGFFILTVATTVCWGIGFYKNWIKPT